MVRSKWVGKRTIQENIKYLASIRLTRIDRPFHRKEFWTKVWRGLENLGLPPEDRMRIEEKLKAIVPQPEPVAIGNKNGDAVRAKLKRSANKMAKSIA